jgi:hypothetical protein
MSRDDHLMLKRDYVTQHSLMQHMLENFKEYELWMNHN